MCVTSATDIQAMIAGADGSRCKDVASRDPSINTDQKYVNTSILHMSVKKI